MIEYQNATPLFAENEGKSYANYSWREIQVRLMFLNRKNQVDSESNRMQNDISNKVMGDSKTKGGR
jgi:hypothetical protein